MLWLAPDSERVLRTMIYDWPCIHRGAPTGEKFDCGCGLGPQDVLTCSHPALGGTCVIRMGKPAVKLPRSCMRCDFREEPPQPPRIVQRERASARPPGVVLPFDARRAEQRAKMEADRKQRIIESQADCDCENADRPAAPFGGPIVRHLAYHICPFQGNGVWQRNVDQLLDRIDLFNGRRVVAIGTGEGLEPPQVVKAAFCGRVDEFIELPNSKTLREVVTFLPLLERVASTASNECTFYAHAKGVTRPIDPGVTVHRWADIMYESLLDHWPLVESLLLRFPLAGSFKKVGHGFAGSASRWHYSGTFYWLRNSEVFSRQWRSVDQVWWGTESWPGLHFAPEEAGCVFRQGKVPSLDLYDFELFHQAILPSYEQWKAAQ